MKVGQFKAVGLCKWN